MVPRWPARVPPAVWLVGAALLLNLATTVAWPALATVGCDPSPVPTTTVHPNGTVTEGPSTPPCESDALRVLRDRGRSWWLEALLFPLAGGHLFSPGDYDARPLLGWTVWALAVASPAATLHWVRHPSAWSWAWRVPLAYLVAGLLSGAWIQEWEQFD